MVELCDEEAADPAPLLRLTARVAGDLVGDQRSPLGDVERECESPR